MAGMTGSTERKGLMWGTGHQFQGPAPAWPQCFSKTQLPSGVFIRLFQRPLGLWKSSPVPLYGAKITHSQSLAPDGSSVGLGRCPPGQSSCRACLSGLEMPPLRKQRPGKPSRASMEPVPDPEPTRAPHSSQRHAPWSPCPHARGSQK